MSDPFATTVLPLQEWLKLLAGRGVEMRTAMTLAAKLYNSHNTTERLGQLTQQKLAGALADKEQRKAVLKAVKGITSGQTLSRKRGRDSDLLEPLPTSGEAEMAPKSLDFHEVLDPEKIIPVTITVNRAPVKTAWAYVVAERLGFDQQEALSIAHVSVHISSLKHALMLGNILNPKETRDAEEEMRELPGMQNFRKKEDPRGSKGKGKSKEPIEDIIGSSQPWVGLMKSRPVIERPDGTWRAIQQGVPAQPSEAYSYITRAMKDYTGHVLGAMRLVANSYAPDELNRLGMHFYNAFKPDVEKWGQRGLLDCAKILDQVKDSLPTDVEVMARAEDGDAEQSQTIKPIHTAIIAEAEIADDTAAGETSTDAGWMLSDPPDVDDGPEVKKPKLSLEEYEAMLDAENGEGGFLEGGAAADVR